MLTELQISNFAIIDRQTVSFGSGLNVISGETGAGKSIILEALELVLGGRGNTELIREGSDALEVRALVDLSSLVPEVRGSLPAIVEGDELLVTRVLPRSGKGKVFINGSLASVSLLQEIMPRIVSVCGQGQYTRLMDRAFHTEVIDSYGDLEALRTAYAEQFRGWRDQRRELDRIEKAREQSEARTEELADKIREIEQARIEPGRREKLEGAVRMLHQRDRVLDGCRAISDLAVGDEGALGRLDTAASELDRLIQINSQFAPLKVLLEGARAHVRELDQELERTLRSFESGGGNAAELEADLAEVARLHRKYRTDDAGLLELLAASKREAALLGDAGSIKELRAAVESAERTMRERGSELTKRRAETGKQLSKAVGAELGELGMAGAALSVTLEECAPTEHGCESLELLISTNKGEPQKPLRQIASGGELSRILLVLKKVLRDRSGVNVLIFDEVDSGVSGGVARAVGEKLKQLATHSQVVCITHLPQIASLADRHLLVEKVVGKRTLSVVKELSTDEKVDEIARMLAGRTITPASRASARELLSVKSV